jgi:hypothetical protein
MKDEPITENTKYWLCCGSRDPMHSDDRARGCIESLIGHPERCEFGTRDDHSMACKGKKKKGR